ncbi:hypothetical protein J6590_042291 [Homalodisca vitripennis]|nr:hypothetical protein J6590_042291 [Homalodisca vitripennis]
MAPSVQESPDIAENATRRPATVQECNSKMVTLAPGTEDFDVDDGPFVMGVGGVGQYQRYRGNLESWNIPPSPRIGRDSENRRW